MAGKTISQLPTASAGNIIGSVTEIESSSGSSYSAPYGNINLNGKNYRVCAGVIRNSGSGWAFIDDSNHTPVGFSGIYATSTSIIVSFDFTATKVGSFIVVPDETFTNLGITAGASVGLTTATIKLRSHFDVGGYIDYTTTDSWILSLAPGIVSASFTSGILALNHADLTELIFAASSTMCNNIQCAIRDRGATALSAFNARPNQTFADRYTLVLRDPSGNLILTPSPNMEIYTGRSGNANINPELLISTLGNFWLFGIFEV